MRPQYALLVFSVCHVPNTGLTEVSQVRCSSGPAAAPRRVWIYVLYVWLPGDVQIRIVRLCLTAKHNAFPNKTGNEEADAQKSARRQIFAHMVSPAKGAELAASVYGKHKGLPE